METAKATAEQMPKVNAKQQQSGSNPNSSPGAQLLLRTMVAATTLGASCVMITSNESKVVFGMNLDARYSYSPAFKFFAWGNAIACAFTLASLFFVLLNGRQVWNWKRANFFFLLFLHDVVIMSLVLAACGAGTAIGYVGKHGNSHAGWFPICGQFHKFCNKVVTSLLLSFVSVLLLLILTIISVVKIKSVHATLNVQA